MHLEETCFRNTKIRLLPSLHDESPGMLCLRGCVSICASQEEHCVCTCSMCDSAMQHLASKPSLFPTPQGGLVLSCLPDEITEQLLQCFHPRPCANYVSSCCLSFELQLWHAKSRTWSEMSITKTDLMQPKYCHEYSSLSILEQFLVGSICTPCLFWFWAIACVDGIVSQNRALFRKQFFVVIFVTKIKIPRNLL